MKEFVSDDILASRDDILLENLILVDGQAGCGKSLFSAIVAVMSRVELLNYSTELENLCALKYLNMITGDAVEAMIRIQMDLVIYETMMSRKANFRPSDVSSVFNNANWFTYLKRLFQKGDEVIPARIKKEKPILHFATHNLLAFSDPIFKALGDRAIILEVVRHPLYMIIQQTLNHINTHQQCGTARQFHLYIKYKMNQLPYWNCGQEKLFIESKPVERAIYEMQKLTELSENYKKQQLSANAVKILTIPFEPFVLDPLPFLKKIEKLLGSKITNKTKRIIKKQNVPREKISDGIPLAIYKRCGWETSIAGFSEKDELQKRRDFAVSEGASNKALEVLDKMSEEYEKQYLCGIL